MPKSKRNRQSANNDRRHPAVPVHIPEVTLSNGTTASLRPSDIMDGARELVVDAHPQSLIIPSHPTRLQYEYIRRIGDVIDALPNCDQGAPITALHLGAGACTLPLYIAARRPASRQQVLELEPALISLVRHVTHVPRGIRFRYGDACSTLDRLPTALLGTVDIIVHDVYAGDAAPTTLRTVETFGKLHSYLKPAGILAMNVATDANYVHVRQCVAGLAAVFQHVAVLADPAVFKTHHDGNLVAIASTQQFDGAWIRQLLSVGPQPSMVMSGPALQRWIAGAQPLHAAADSH